MQKPLATMIATAAVISLLTGCGVPQDQHEAMITQLKMEHQKEIEKLNVKVEQSETLFKSEQAKLRTARIELDEVGDKVSTAKQDSANAKKELAAEKAKLVKLERELASAKSKAMGAQDQVVEVEEKLAALEKENNELKRRFEQFQRNLRGASNPPKPIAAKPAPSAKPYKKTTPSALDILNDMSAQ